MKHYKKGWRLVPIVRAIAVLSAVGIITTAVTFAALQSNGNALTGNTIQTATASLKISRDGTTYSDSVPGYDFNSIVPGGSPQPQNGYMVALKNVGSTSLALNLSIPAQPVATGIADMSKVRVIVTEYLPNGGTFPVQTFKLSDLIAGKVSLTRPIDVNDIHYYRLQVAMDADAVNGSGGSITGLDLSFGGMPQ